MHLLISIKTEGHFDDGPHSTYTCTLHIIDESNLVHFICVILVGCSSRLEQQTLQIASASHNGKQPLTQFFSLRVMNLLPEMQLRL